MNKSAQTTYRQATDRLGNNLYYLKDSNTGALSAYTGTEAASDAYPSGYELSNVPVISSVSETVRGLWSNVTGNRGYQLGGGGGNASALLDAIAGVATNATSVTPIGGGLNYFLKSDKLNLAAIIQASKTDTRAKYIASPIVMTVDNKEATIDATENRQFLTGWTAQSGSYGNSGQPTPSYSSKDIGIKLKMTPKINPNGTVMLTVEEEYSRFVKDGQSMLIPQEGKYVNGNVDLAVERKMSADVLLENGQSIVLGGLTETAISETESGIPLLKDIPWIGKWLFGSVSQSEARKELLVFMTPYVLDDAEMAQAEALRRKRALSDPKPWDDHGWSASALADPVSKKELMRRLKDEAKKQDEERKTKLAIEKYKLDRAKALEKMDESERKFWIDAHRDELEKEEKKKFDEEMKEQADLKLLATQIKQQRMEKAEAKIKEAEEQMQSENEHGRLEAEKAKRGTGNGESGTEQPIAQPVSEQPVAEQANGNVAEIKSLMEELK